MVVDTKTLCYCELRATGELMGWWWWWRCGNNINENDVDSGINVRNVDACGYLLMVIKLSSHIIFL